MTNINSNLHSNGQNKKITQQWKQTLYGKAQTAIRYNWLNNNLAAKHVINNRTHCSSNLTD